MGRTEWLFFPDYRLADPYQSLLAAALSPAVTPRPGGIAEALDIAVAGRPVVFHIHWEDAVFAGAALGVLAALVAIGIAFAEHGLARTVVSDGDDEPASARFGAALRPALAVVVPVAVLAPVAFLLCLAIRV